MKEVRLLEPFKMEIINQDMPKISSNEVLLKIHYVGICGSDIQIYQGKHKYAAMPVTMGHEVAAEIVNIGSEVNDYQVGDYVTIQPQIYCGECQPCLSGRFNVCEKLKVFGVHVDGANAEYMAIDPKYLHKLPENLDLKYGALVEPIAVGMGSVKRSRRVINGNVVVIGAGTIGNLTAQAARIMGAKKVMITDINDEKLKLAKDCGVDFTVNTMKTSLSDAIIENFGIQKADVIIDCAAIPAVLKEVLTIARPNSDVVITGNYKVPVEIELPLIQRNEVSLIGHMMYVKEDFEDVIKYLKDFQIDKIITKVYKLDEYPAAIDFVYKNPNENMKTIVQFE